MTIPPYTSYYYSTIISRIILMGAIATSYSGCIHFGDTLEQGIVSRPCSEWSESDAFNLIATSMSNNFINPNQVAVKVNATAYFPTTIFAIQREASIKNHWTEERFRTETDQLLEQSMGIFYEWDSSRFVDKNGNYLRNVRQYESLEFLVTIMNTQYPCVPPMVHVLTPGGDAMAPLLLPGDMPCYHYEIKDLDTRIVLKNDKGREAQPFYIWGRNHDVLTTTETLFIKFPLRSRDGQHLLDGCSELCLEIDGFNEGPIQLHFPVKLSMMPIARMW